MRLTNRAKHLRRTMTEAEHRLWYHLRAHRFAHAKFKRQVVIGRYIADFAAIQRRLIIELDGSHTWIQRATPTGPQISKHSATACSASGTMTS